MTPFLRGQDSWGTKDCILDGVNSTYLGDDLVGSGFLGKNKTQLSTVPVFPRSVSIDSHVAQWRFA